MILFIKEFPAKEFFNKGLGAYQLYPGSLLRSPMPFLFILMFCLALGLMPIVALSQNKPSVIDEGYDLVNRQFIDLIGDVDGFFGGVAAGEDQNSSWARVRLGVTDFESDSVDVRGNIKLKLVLPNTEKRLQLLLSTEDEDNLDSGNVRSGTVATSDNENISLALRFLQSVRSSGSFKLDLGARVRDDSGQAFLRFNATRRFLESGDGELRDLVLINNLWYFSSSGYENRLKLVYRQLLRSPYADFFQSVSEATWQEGERGARFVQTYAAFRKLDDRTHVGLEAIADLVTSPEPDSRRLASVEARLRYRQNLWRPWFYYEVTPRIRWEDEFDYSARLGIQLQVEAFLGSFQDKVAIVK